MAQKFSHSRLELFSDCRRKYAFKYIEKVEAQTRRSVNLFTGELLHQCLERLYKGVQMEKAPTLDELLSFYNEQWDKESEETLDVFSENATLADFRADGEKALRRYYERHKDFGDSEVLAVEHLFTVELDPVREILITGKIDRVDRNSDGSLTLVDYKYRNQIQTQPQVDRDPQLALYTLAAQTLWPQFKTINVALVDLKRDMTFTTTFPPELLDERRAEITGMVMDIHAALKLDDFPPHESPLCSFCEYFTLCPAKRHAQLLEDELTPDEVAIQLKRVAADYMSAKDQEKEVKGRVSALRDDLLKYASEIGVTAAEGERGRVNINQTVVEEFPPKTKDRESYEAVSQLLRNAEDGIFELYADVNLKDLAKALKKEQLPPELSEPLRQLLVEKKSPRVTIKARFDADPDDSDSED